MNGPRRESISRIIMQGAGVSMAVRISGMGLSYVANILLSRTLGLQSFGEYVIALSWALMLTLPAKAGFDNSALRYSSIYLERRDDAALRGFIRFATITVISASAVIGTFVLAAGAILMPVGTATRTWTAALIPPLALLAFYSVVMRTAGRIVSAQLYEQIVRPALIIAGVAVASFARIRLSPSSAMGLTAIAATAALLGLMIVSWYALRSVRSRDPKFDEWRQWLAVSLPMLMLGVIQELMNQVDIILLGQLATRREAALFAAAWRLASLVPFALVGLATMAGPLIAAAHERGASDELHRVSSIVARGGFAFALVSAALLYVCGRPLLALFGPGFVEANNVLSVLLLGGIVNAFTGVVAYFATLTGRERHGLLIFGGALALSVLLNIVLIPRFGAVGAAVASSSATVAWNIAMLVYVRRATGIDASALALPIRPAKGDDAPDPLA